MNNHRSVSPLGLQGRTPTSSPPPNLRFRGIFPVLKTNPDMPDAFAKQLACRGFNRFFEHTLAEQSDVPLIISRYIDFKPDMGPRPFLKFSPDAINSPCNPILHTLAEPGNTLLLPVTPPRAEEETPPLSILVTPFDLIRYQNRAFKPIQELLDYRFIPTGRNDVAVVSKEEHLYQCDPAYSFKVLGANNPFLPGNAARFAPTAFRLDIQSLF